MYSLINFLKSFRRLYIEKYIFSHSNRCVYTTRNVNVRVRLRRMNAISTLCKFARVAIIRESTDRVNRVGGPLKAEVVELWRRKARRVSVIRSLSEIAFVM